MMNTKNAFEHNGALYATTGKGYFYKTVGTDMRRVSMANYEKAWDEFIGTVSAADEEWENEVNAPKVEAAKKREEGDRAAEKKMAAKSDKVSKPRPSKDVAFRATVTLADVTLTAKQVDFLRHIPDTGFYENGLDSTPWCDVLADEIGGQFAGKPMTVGAMISTLREKDVIYVGTDRVNGKKVKYFGFTEMGKKIAAELGLA